jgi:hypothetical protein
MSCCLPRSSFFSFRVFFLDGAASALEMMLLLPSVADERTAAGARRRLDSGATAT